jgi:Heterokaryon incompatibility protein (HET)
MASDYADFSYIAPLISRGVSSSRIFPHKPLSSSENIRLLKIHAGDLDERVATTIYQIQLETAPPYEAISYTWGSESGVEEITCGPDGYRIRITKNCESVLRRLQLPDEERLVWIDAICIDQTSIEERNAQVAIMGQIYKTASRVIIDIGETSANSALDCIIHCSDEWCSKFSPDAVEELYSRPWFKRVWVLQEAYMSKEAYVLCGTRFVPWSYFKPHKVWVDSKYVLEQENWHMPIPFVVPHALTVGSHKTRTYTARKDLLPLLCKSRTCSATDPRDKVFALIPMLGALEAEELHADYAVPTVQVYTEIATWLLSAFGLSFLPCVNGVTKLIDLPSWVPDWSLNFREVQMIGLGGVYYPLSAGGNIEAVAEVLLFNNNTTELKVRGIAVDTIRKLSKTIDIRSDNAALAEFVSDCGSYRTQDPSGPPKKPALRHWKARTDATRLHPPPWAASEYGIPLQYPDRETDNDLSDKMTFFCVGRQLMLTEHGYFGVVPEDAEVGDTVCCFLGAGVPYILREVGYCCRGTEKSFKLVGESYVYGLMEGEAFEGIDMSDIQKKTAPEPLEDFHIC